MEGPAFVRGGRGRGRAGINGSPGRGRPVSQNQHWTATDPTSRGHTPNGVNGERWERGGHRGGGRGRGLRGSAPKFHNVSLRLNNNTPRQPTPQAEVQPPPVQVEEVHEEGEHYDEDMVDEHQEVHDAEEENASGHLIVEPEFETQEERDKFYQELVKAREEERKTAIAEGKMDDPNVPKRLEDAISVVGTCPDMCPRFERYRRERQNNLFEWETIPGTKRVDHNRAVKMYERAAGDKTLPSDLRPPKVLKRTLNYLFHDLLPRGGFSPTFNFIRDRSRAVRNDFTMQHLTGPSAIECHDRCARFHILALHIQRDVSGFSIPLEEQQLMNTLQSLKEFYEDQRGRYQSLTELEMRVYHRLIHIRDQRERHDDIPEHILSHPVFKLTTDFRKHVQTHSAPITKQSKLVVTAVGMEIFGQLAFVLTEQGSSVMVYLVACILERLFGKDTIEDIETLKGDLTLSEIIDGVSTSVTDPDYAQEVQQDGADEMEDMYEDTAEDYNEADVVEEVETQHIAPTPLKPSATEWLSNNFGSTPSTTASSSATPATIVIPPSAPTSGGAFGSLVSQPNVFGATNVFGNSVFSTSQQKPSPTPVFGNLSSSQNNFGSAASTTPTVQPTPSPFSNVASFSASKQQPMPSFIPTSIVFGGNSPSTTNVNTASVSPIPEPTKNASIFGTNPFSNGFPKVNPSDTNMFSSSKPSFFSSPASLNPKAPEFTPPKATSSSIFSQPLSVPTINGANKLVPEPTIIFDTAPPATSATTLPSISFSQPAPSSASSFANPSPPAPAVAATPQLSRPTAPPLPKINTNTSSGSSSSPSAASPRVAPPAPKIQPVSLPSTPNTQTYNPLLGHLRSALDPRGSPSWNSSQEILSPLVIGTPTSSDSKQFHNFTPLSTPQHSRVFRATSPSPPSKNSKGKARDRSMYDDLKEVEEMKRKAVNFAQKSLLVKETFSRWLKRAMERAAYHEACRHGDEYRQKILSQSQSRQSSILRTSSSRPDTPLDKKRRISTNGVDATPLKKRARKRMSTEYKPPKTDEELAERFKSNHEEHEQRWAQGSFLKVIRKHAESRKPSAMNLPWDIWLSLNPDSDATAIWLERKFDMPSSGSWVSETVFSVPLSPAKSSPVPGNPGLIVFECSPLGDTADDLEKKYRILDDCTRLREVIKAMPARRQFIPSLLIINWAEDESSLPSDLLDMVKQIEADSTVAGFHVFTMTATTKDLDNKLKDILISSNLDLEGKLVQSLTSRAVFKLLEPSFTSFLEEWMENCSYSGRRNWSLYGQVIQASISVLNVMSQIARAVLEISSLQDPLPDFDYKQVDDSESTYDDIMEWLSALDSRDEARMIAMDIQSHRNIGQEFPMRAFLEHLFELAHTRFERLDPSLSSSARLILKSDISLALEAFKEEIQPHQMKLLRTYNFSVRRSPKRRSYSVATSEQNSPQAKRPRLSDSIASSVVEDFPVPVSNGKYTPSPSTSTVSLAPTEGPVVTVAMLRALTKDLKKKYMVS